MSEMVERVAISLLRTRYSASDVEAHWPDTLDELVNGPPFDAEGYRAMARAAIEAMREPTEEMVEDGTWSRSESGRYEPKDIAITIYRAMIDAALGKVDA